MFLEKLRRFMYGRYGTDELNLVLMILGIIVMFLSRIFWFWPLAIISFCAYICCSVCSRATSPRGKKNIILS